MVFFCSFKLPLGCNLKISPAFRFFLQPRDEITFFKRLFTANKACHQHAVFPTIYSVATQTMVQSAMFISFFFGALNAEKSRNPRAHNTAASNKVINKPNWKRIFKWTRQLYVWVYVVNHYDTVPLPSKGYYQTPYPTSSCLFKTQPCLNFNRASWRHFRDTSCQEVYNWCELCIQYDFVDVYQSESNNV